MKLVEAEKAVVAYMREHLPEIPYRGADGGLIAYLEMERQRPDLLRFRTSVGDKWQVVSAWLSRHKLRV